jgi:hypothetical protein
MHLPDFAGQNICLLFELRSRKLLESAVMVFVSEDPYRDVMLRYNFIQSLVPKLKLASAPRRIAPAFCGLPIMIFCKTLRPVTAGTDGRYQA